MPFKSRAERERLKGLVSQGLFHQADFDALEADTDHTKLPERVTPQARAKIPTRLPKGPGSRYDRAAKARLY